MTIGRFQIVRWGEWRRVGWWRWDESWEHVYRWSLWLGWVEIRRMADGDDDEEE